MDPERLDHLVAVWTVDALTEAEGRELADAAAADARVREMLAEHALVRRLLMARAADAEGPGAAEAVVARLRLAQHAARADTITDDGERSAGQRAQLPPARHSRGRWALLAVLAAVAAAAAFVAMRG